MITSQIHIKSIYETRNGQRAYVHEGPLGSKNKYYGYVLNKDGSSFFTGWNQDGEHSNPTLDLVTYVRVATDGDLDVLNLNVIKVLTCSCGKDKHGFASHLGYCDLSKVSLVTSR